VSGDRLCDRQDGWQWLVLDQHAFGSGARFLLGLSDHPCDRLAVKANLTRKERLIATCRADIVFARHICSRQHREHAVHLERSAAVEPTHPRVRMRRAHRPSVRALR
jgi:hypothetical protein